MLTLTRSEVRPFTDKQIELVTTFADQAVIAIENVRLFDQVQARTRELSEALEQQTATSEVMGVISSSPGELEPVFQAMLANAVRICEAKIGTLYLREGDGFRTVATQNASGQARTGVGARPYSAFGQSRSDRRCASRSGPHFGRAEKERSPSVSAVAAPAAACGRRPHLVRWQHACELAHGGTGHIPRHRWSPPMCAEL